MEQTSQSSEYSSQNVATDVAEKKESVQSQEVGSRGTSAENTAYTTKDFYHAKPPDFKSRVQTFFYYRGLGSMPEYLRNIYNKIPRKFYVNYDLPEEMRDDYGRPILTYPRNKIRTTKYTPLSFLPKNLAVQFTNVANSYFLLLVILGAFQLFGVASPGLAAVPLIVIVCITAIKDALEDNRRNSSDSDLNNSPIHLLQGLPNPNAATDKVGPWRKFKKSCTRGTNATGRFFKELGIKIFASKRTRADHERKKVEQDDLALRRISTIESDYTYRSQVRNSQAYSRQSRVLKRFIPDSLLHPQLQKEEPIPTTFKNRRWKDISVGDFIRVREDEEVPADIVLISTSDIEGNCYIETKNLDGESNLKIKSAPNCGNATHVKHARDFTNLKFWIECDPPNAQLYSFRGTIHYENYNEDGVLENPDEKESLTNKNVLLRGSTLRNTKWIVGVVAYTGQESKIMLNSGITPTKVSRISRELNLSVVINFTVLFIICFISGLINGLFYDKKHNSRLYFEFKPYGSSAASNGVIAFFVALIIYQSLVPISLYISVEIIKSFQAFLIYSDLKMYYEKLDFPCTPKTWNISDDLGQIEYIFSDKTGTLTQNVMEFKKCTINGKSYGLAYTEAKQGMDKRQGIDIVKEATKWERIIKDDREEMIQKLKVHAMNDQLRDEYVTFVSSDYVDDILKDSPQKSANERFMLALSLCHTVVTESNESSDFKTFKSESPDESALVSVARDLGFVFNNRTRASLSLDIYNQRQQYELLEVIPFNSTRKRMSTIVRTPDNRILLHCKGADNVIYQRLDKNLNDDEVLHKTALHLEEYAKEGLRTLCIAEKEISPKEFESWLKRYKDAQSTLEDQEDLILSLTDEIERDLILIGGTAIEDRLQDGVPDAISLLGDAGIKLWVLTGDRIETAINIGFSCNLLDGEVKLLVIRPDETNSVEHVEGLITKYLNEEFEVDTENGDVADMIKKAKADHSTPSKKYAVIIEGFALGLVFNEEYPDLQRKFLLLCKNCKSVICCRVSPSQKASVVKLVKNNLDVMTLAIGDGANDVAMIQAANVGIGIAGEEGRQAVMSADYAVGQFRYLTRLLLVHGRWSYKRLAKMVPSFFYKNVVFTFTCFWFGVFNNFDGSYLYEYTMLMFYNLAFTSLPVIVLAIFDQDVSDTVSLLVPQLYKSGILGLEWTQYKFLWYMVDGFYQSVISFFFPYLLFYKSFQNPQGLTVDHRFWMGVVVCCVAVTSCDLYVLMQQYRWDWLSLLIDAISILLVYFWVGAWSARILAAGEFYKAGAQVFGTLSCWCCIFIGILICLLPRFTIDFLRRNFRPKDVDIIREQVRRGVYDKYPEGYDPTNKEDVEKFRILSDLMEKDPHILEKLDPQSDKESVHSDVNKLSRAFKTIKRKATVSRSRNASVRSRRDTLNDTFRKPINLEELRLQMIKDGELNSRASLERINTTHQLPGLTQAETLISYHAKSINLAD